MATVFINEFHYDNTGGDTGEFVEIAGPAGTDLSAFTLFFYNGANDTIYDSLALSGLIDDEGAGFGAVSFLQAPIQNGAPDGIALAMGSDLVQFLSYEGAFTASGGVADGVTSIDIGVAENAGTPVGFSLQLTGTGSAFSDFTFVGPLTASPGSINAGQTFEAIAAVPLDDSLSFMLIGVLGLAALLRRAKAA